MKSQIAYPYDYEPWFMSDSLEADYGQYTCDRCQREFYHSPSTITSRAGTTVYTCCCGHCTNALLGRDYAGQLPYS
jgi:hypothetical protein